ncbi:MAG TPA: SLBB domain-containing protein [Ktedonobacterales bacterium]
MRDAGSSASQGWFTRLLRSSYFAPLTLAVIAVLVVGIVVQLLAIAGAFPGSRAAQNRVVITGPGRTGSGDQIQSYVLGAVVSPGVYALPRGSRVHDLVAAAGGATADADLARVSLAGALADGGTVYIPRVGESIPLTLGGKLNISTASERDFRYALGISADIAQRIVAYRTAHGPFTAISQLLLVPISQTTYDRIRLLVTV